MKINIPLDSVKKQIREEFRIAPLVTPEMREAEDLWMLEFAGEKYIPTSNEMLLAAAAGGQVGSFMGFTWIEVNGFASSADLAYYPHGGTKASVTAANLAKVEFIMYDPNAFGVGDNFSIVRMVDSELFAGTKAQVEENAALRVLDAAQVHVKSYASA